jgi:hypothetical protein
MNLPDISSPGGRKAWAFLAMVGGAMVFTLFAAVGVWLVRNSIGLSFWLAVLAHAQVFVVLTGLAALLVKRSVKISRDSVEIDDKGEAE